MKVCIVGLGAVGGLMAARLARAGHAVSALARGATLQAIKRQSLTLQEAGQLHAWAIAVAADPRELGPQDLVVIALKSPALPAAADAIAALCHPGTLLLPAMNGVPWWFLHSTAVRDACDRRLATVDPHGSISTA